MQQLRTDSPQQYSAISRRRSVSSTGRPVLHSSCHAHLHNTHMFMCRCISSSRKRQQHTCIHVDKVVGLRQVDGCTLITIHVWRQTCRHAAPSYIPKGHQTGSQSVSEPSDQSVRQTDAHARAYTLQTNILVLCKQPPTPCTDMHACMIACMNTCIQLADLLA